MINIKSIRNNLGANALTVIINIGFQLVSIPIFLKYFGVQMYGEWLVLTAITAYFSMTDIGLNTVTANEFSIAYAQNDYKKCNKLFNNNLIFINIIFGFVFLALLILFPFINLTSLFNFKIISESTSETVLFLLIFQVFIGMTSNLFDSVYRATNRNARGVMINNLIRLAENIILITSLLLKLPLELMVVFFIIPKILGLIIKYFNTKKYYELKISIKYFDSFELKKITIPALSFLSFPIGNSIILQGFTLLVSFTLGSVAVVVFNTTRTLVNFVKVGLGLINNSVWPELSLAYGRTDFVTMKNIHRYSVSASFYLSLTIAIFLLLFGKTIYVFWTGGEIEFNSILFFSFLLTLITNTIWFTSSVVLASTNNHQKFSIYYLIATSLSIVAGYFIVVIFNNISFLPLSLLLIDIFLIRFVLKQSLYIVEDNFPNFIKYIFLQPIAYLKIGVSQKKI